MSVFKLQAQEVYINKPVKRGVYIPSIIKGIPLVRSGINTYICCPFHHEKTPSMSIKTSADIWHCFGCGSSNRYKPDTEKQTNLNDLRKIVALRLRLDLRAVEFNIEFAKEIEYTVSHVESTHLRMIASYDYDDCPF